MNVRTIPGNVTLTSHSDGTSAPKVLPKVLPPDVDNVYINDGMVLVVDSVGSLNLTSFNGKYRENQAQLTNSID